MGSAALRRKKMVLGPQNPDNKLEGASKALCQNGQAKRVRFYTFKFYLLAYLVLVLLVLLLHYYY